ncbi:MAG: cytochrome c3 family protein [Deltaproteobacteria bacterium]|nr:cytochrome c3 family protein [Deltaproteobacteria bacterium]
MRSPSRYDTNFTLGVIFGAAVLIFFSSILFTYAGDFHTAGTLACSDCHVMHYSSAHSLTGVPGPDPLLGSGGPFPKLLKNAPSQLCLACHDGKTDAPDVRGANTGTHVRAAGQLNVMGDGYEGTGHTLGSNAVPPGGTWSNPGLECLHCHSTHGNTYYRNLTPNPGTSTGKTVTYMTGPTYAGTVSIQQLSQTPLATHYSASNIRYRQTLAGSTDFGLSEWCGGCHGNFHGGGGTANVGGSPTGDTGSYPWLRHPTRDVTMAEGATNRHIDSNHWFSSLPSRVPVVSPTDTIPGTASTSDNEVFCGSCHKAHGSQNRKGLIFDDETTPSLEDGTSLNQLCQQCHYQ